MAIGVGPICVGGIIHAVDQTLNVSEKAATRVEGLERGKLVFEAFEFSVLSGESLTIRVQTAMARIVNDRTSEPDDLFGGRISRGIRGLVTGLECLGEYIHPRPRRDRLDGVDVGENLGIPVRHR